MRIVLKIGKILLIILLLALAGGWGITTLYDDELIRRMTTALNERLRTEVTVEEINLTLWKRFPNAALRFGKVFIPVPESSDTLVAAEELFLEVNLRNLMQGHYVVDGLTLRNGVAYPDRDRWGRPNYLILKATGNESDADFSLDLQKVRLENMHLRYTDASRNMHFEGSGLHAQVSGNFGTGRLHFGSRGKTRLRMARFQDTQLPKDLPFSWSLRLDVSGDTITLTQADIDLNGLPFKANGSYRPELTDLHLTGADLSLKHLLSLLPEKMTGQYDRRFEAEGKLDFQARLVGDPEEQPEWYADFSLNRGKLKDPGSDQVLRDLKIKGQYHNGAGDPKSAVLELSEFSGQAKGSAFSGQFSMTGSDSPLIRAKLKAELELGQISAFLPPALSRELYGTARLQMQFGNHFQRIDEVRRQDLINARVSGSLQLLNVQLATDYLKHPIQELNGRFTFTNRDLRIDSCSGHVADSDFAIKGFFRNTLAYALIPGEPVALEAEFSSQNLDLDDLLADSDSETEYSLKLSPRVSYDLNVNMAQLSFGKFSAKNIQGRFLQTAGVLRAQPLTFEAADGSFDGRLVVNGRKQDELQVRINADIRNVDIQRLFYEFSNFGQSTLVSSNVEGRTDASIEFSSCWTPQLVTDLDRMTATADVSIRDGALIGFEPLKALSDFAEVEELENVQFKTLRNQIVIRGQTIYIPDMTINSSALDFAGNGSHTFDNQIDYHIRMRLSDVLVRRHEKERPDLGEHYVFEQPESGPLLFLSMTGDVHHPDIGYDARSASQNIAAELRDKGRELREAFREEFKPDTTRDRTQTEPDFVIEWNEEEEP